MKNINPLNSDVKPEETLPSAPAPATPEEPSQQPQAAPASAQPIYPTPLSVEERRLQKEQLSSDAQKASGFSISQIIIAGIVGLYALYVIVQSLISLAPGAAFGLLYAFSPGGTFLKYVWLTIIFSFVICIMAIAVSYKVLRGSKIALALLTGPIVIYLQYKLILYIVALDSFGGLFSSAQLIIHLVAEITLAVMIVLAWTKDKKYYF